MKHPFLLIGYLLAIFNIMNTDAFSQNLSDECPIFERVSKRQFVEEIVVNHIECIKEFSEDKIYIYSDAIHLTSKGTFLKNKGTLLPIPTLLSDAGGPYISTADTSASASLIRCIGCGWVRFSGEACRNPECPLYGG